MVLCGDCMDLIDVEVDKHQQERFHYFKCINDHVLYLDRQTGKNGTITDKKEMVKRVVVINSA
jgi:hypothetical protein